MVTIVCFKMYDTLKPYFKFRLKTKYLFNYKP